MGKNKKCFVEWFAQEDLKKLCKEINTYAKDENLKIVQVSYARDENCTVSEMALVVFEKN